MTEYSSEQKRACAIREVKQREKVYPGLVQRGRMSQEQADWQIAVMKAIAMDYDRLAESERLL